MSGEAGGEVEWGGWEVVMAVPNFLAELMALAPHQLVATPGTTDEVGTFLPSGPALSIPCQIEGESRLVRDPQGREVVSSHTIYCLEFNDLSVDRHRYTLPAGFGPPRENIIAISVDPVSDEDSNLQPLYEVVSLP